MVRRYYIDQTNARYRAAAASDTPFHERLVHFWSNHFAVSADKQPIPAIAGLFEQEAIRPNVTGKFIDMLAIDREGHLVVLELKRDRTSREIVAQALDYGSWVRYLEDEDIAEVYGAFRQRPENEDLPDSLDEAFKSKFNVPEMPEALNEPERLPSG